MNDKNVGAKKIRLGVFCIFLWWFPFWASTTWVSNTLGTKYSVTLAVIVSIQTIIGLVGFWLVGQPVAKMLKKLPFKKVPGNIWFMLVHGKEKPHQDV